MGVYRNGKMWWADFTIAGKRYRMSTKRKNRSEAEIESARMRSELIKQHDPELAQYLDIAVRRQWRQPRHKVPSQIYLIRGGDHYKIGVTCDPEVRMMALQTAFPAPLEIVATAEFTEAFFAEKAFHRHFAEKRTAGEWFSLDADDVEYVKKCFSDENFSIIELRGFEKFRDTSSPA